MPGERVNLGAFGFGEYGHAKYTRFKVKVAPCTNPASLVVSEKFVI